MRGVIYTAASVVVDMGSEAQRRSHSHSLTLALSLSLSHSRYLTLSLTHREVVGEGLVEVGLHGGAVVLAPVERVGRGQVDHASAGGVAGDAGGGRGDMIDSQMKQGRESNGSIVSQMLI